MDGENTLLWNSRTWRPNRKKIQGVFQDASGSLNPALSVYHNLETALVNLTNLDREERRKQILELMELTGMKKELLSVPTPMLSGGEQRRLSLLRALSVKPSYLILDEVVSGLDLITADAVLSVLEKYKEEYKCGCLFITHDNASAYRISDRILKMEAGRVVKMAVKAAVKCPETPGIEEYAVNS